MPRTLTARVGRRPDRLWDAQVLIDGQWQSLGLQNTSEGAWMRVSDFRRDQKATQIEWDERTFEVEDA